MRFRPLIGIALMTAVINNWSLADENSGQEAVRTEKTTAGVILEYNQEPAAKPGQADIMEKDTPAPDTGTSVELIVGGQAEDGVAKRKEIPVRK